MKWIAFIGALLAALPLGLLLRRTPRLQVWLWTLVGLLPFVMIGSLDINIISFESYRGDSSGIEITVLDLLLVSLWIARPHLPTPPRSLRITYAVYFATALFSVLQAAEPLFSWFSIWKLVRMYAVLHVVTAIARDPQGFLAIVRGMAVALLCQALVTLIQRYGLGVYQAPGLFAHQNSLGTAVCMVAPVLLALTFAQPGSWLLGSAVAAGGLALVFGVSRGSLTIFVLVIALTFFVSLSRDMAPRKLAVTGLALVFTMAVLLKASDTIVERFATAPKASAESRIRLENVAAQMLRDHPLGIGINQYSAALLQQGYAEETDTGKRLDASGEPVYGGIAHNIYWLTAAELGYPGIVAFAWLILVPFCTALIVGWRLGGPRGDLLLGLGIGLLGLWLHGFLEWTFRQTAISYLFWMLLGLIGSSTGALHARRPQRLYRSRVPGAPDPRP